MIAYLDAGTCYYCGAALTEPEDSDLVRACAPCIMERNIETTSGKILDPLERSGYSNRPLWPRMVTPRHADD